MCFQVGRDTSLFSYNSGRIDPEKTNMVDYNDCKALDTHYKCRFPTLFTTPTCMNIVIEPRFSKIIPTFWAYSGKAPYTRFIDTFSETYNNLCDEIVTNYNKTIEPATPKLANINKSKSFF